MGIDKIQDIDLPDDIKLEIRQLFTRKLPPEHIIKLVAFVDTLEESKYNPLIKIIFDTAHELEYPINRSTANRKLLGVANWFSRNAKNLRSGWQKRDDMILVEGDSWFEHPFIKDIIDHLIGLVDSPVYTLAYGGDWIGNYVEKQKYLKSLKKYQPKVFLLSGGGNDLVGDRRIRILVKKREEVIIDFSEADQVFSDSLHNEYGEVLAKKIVLGRKFFKDDFWIAMNVFLFQYLLILKSIENESELNRMQIIIQGYDFAIPDNNKKNLFRKLLGHSIWLYQPLNENGIQDQFERESVVAAMIHEFNEMLNYLAQTKSNLYFVDCRRAAGPDDWNDEIHVKSHVFKKIALTYKMCIESNDRSVKRYAVRNIK